MGLVKQLVTLVVLVGLAGGGYLLYKNNAGSAAEQVEGRGGARERRATSVEVVAAQEKDIARTVEAVGSSRALQSVDIVPLADGRLVSLSISPGEEIEAGAVIATLDDEIEQATLAEAEATLRERSNALERAQTLVSSNTMSQATLEQLRSQYEIARAGVDRARRRLADRTVRAPFRGVLGLGSIDLGARVDDGTVLTTIDDLSEVEIQFSLPELVYGQIETGQSVTAQSAAFPGRTFTGRIDAIDSRVDATSRAFRVRARVPNPDRLLPAGMFMHLVLELESRKGVMVPEEAIAVEGGATYVFVVSDGTAQRRQVTLGKRIAGEVELVDGVAIGEAVVTRGLQSLRDGGAVEVIGADEGVGTADAEPRARRS